MILREHPIGVRIHLFASLTLLTMIRAVAPEVIELKGASPASDIWSLACTIIELLTGRPPYADVENGMSGE